MDFDAQVPAWGQPPGGGLHPTVTYGQPGGQQATVLPDPRRSQQGGFAPTQVRPQEAPTVWSPQNLPPMPGQGQQPQQGQPQVPQWGQQQWGQQPPQQQFQPQQQAPQQQPASPWGAAGPQQQVNHAAQLLQQAQPQPTPHLAGQPQAGQFSNETVLDGPGVPQELRGRTMGQVMSIYSALAQDWIQRQGRQPGQAPPNQPQPQYQTQGQAVGAPTSPAQRFQRQQFQQPQQQFQQPPQQQAPQGQPQGWSWQDPGGSFKQIATEAAREAVAPLLERNQANSVAQARVVASQAIHDWQQLEGEVMGMLANGDPQQLADPNVWVAAADLARGRRGRQPQGQPQGQPNGQHFQQSRVMPSIGAAVIPQNQFFAEGPTPPSQFQGQGRGLTPLQDHFRRAMGMSEQDYFTWSTGVQR